MQNTPQE